MVTSLRLSTAETRLAFVRAPARDVREESTADMDGDMGTVRTVSMLLSSHHVRYLCNLSGREGDGTGRTYESLLPRTQHPQ